jgi:hypothetical protein
MEKPEVFVPADNVLRVWDMDKKEVAVWRAAKYRGKILITLLRQLITDDAELIERLKEIE